MARDLTLRVRWTSERTVNVHIDVEPEVAGRGNFAPQSFPEVDEDAFYPIDESALDSPAALLSFLQDATRNEANGATVDMLLREPDEPKLLRLLGHTGPVTGPITIEIG